MIFCADHLYPELYQQLQKVDNVLLIPETKNLYSGIRNHPDLHLCPANNQLYISNEVEASIKGSLLSHKLSYQVIDTPLGHRYPKTALLNVVLTPTHLIYNPESIAKGLLNHAKALKLKLIPVKQGYTRCTTIPLNNDTFITDDPGIYKVLQHHQIKVFKVIPNKVLLRCHPTGFIGGTAGVIGNTLYFNGDITAHPSYKVVISACQAAHLELKYVPGKPLEDIGSILHYRSLP